MILSFREFELDTDRVELRKSGDPVKVTRQAYELLRFFTQNPQRILSKDEIVDAVWDGRVVTEATISTSIKTARQILGDDGQTQSFIRTAHGLGYEFTPEVRSLPTETEELLSLPVLKGKPSVAVLPFDNFSGNPSDQFIADGLTEEITASLAKFRGLLVYSRITSAKMAVDGATAQHIHAALGADFVLNGSVRKSTDTLRVRVHLVDAKNGTTLLTEQFERSYTPDGIFDIQDEIALLAAGRVGDLYGPIGQTVKRLGRSGRPESWDTMVWLNRFYDYYATRDPQLHAEAEAGLTKALETDATSSEGWAALAFLRVEEFRLPYHHPPQFELLDTALDHARRAVKLDPENELAFVALALTHFHRVEVDEFEIAANRAIQLNPGNSHSLAEISMCYCLMSKFELAVPLAKRAIELSPVHPGWFRMPTACGLFMQGYSQAALQEQQKAPWSGYFWYHAHLAAYYADLDMMDKASEEVAAVRQLYPEFEERIFLEGRVLCVGKPFFDHMAGAWRKAGFNLPEGEYVPAQRGVSRRDFKAAF